MKASALGPTPFFTIILPTYNRELLIGASIDSIVAQKFIDWELIIIDDGSIDDTNQIVGAYESRDDRIQYYYQDNSERSVARNNGISKARGKYVCFIDSDDLYEDDNLEEWYSFIKELNFPRAMMFGSLKYIEGGVSSVISHALTGDKVHEFLLCNPIVPSRVCVSKTILEEVVFEPSITIGEDVTLWLKIATKFPIFAARHITAKYIVHPGNSTSSGSGASLKMLNSFKIFFKRYPVIRKQIKSKVFKAYISEVHVNVAKDYRLKNRIVATLYHLIRALVLAPFHPQTKHRLVLIKESLFL